MPTARSSSARHSPRKSRDAAKAGSVPREGATPRPFAAFLTIAAVAAVLMLPGHEAAGEWIQKGMHGAAAKAHKAEKKRWSELAREIRKLSPQEVRWGKERRPRGSRVVTLSAPFPTSDRRKVEVEWFFTYTRGWQKGPSEWLERFLRSWEKTLPGTVRLKVSPVGSMPGTTDRYDEMHAAHQELVFASQAIGEGERVHAAMRTWLSNRVRRQRLHTPQDVERFLRGLGVELERYRKAAASAEVQGRMRATTAKLEAVSKQAEAVESNANAPPRDPILLINGKHLVQGSLAGGVRAALRIANWVIRRELEGGR